MTVDERQATEPRWHDRTPVVTAAGLAALALIGLLIYAVLQMSDGSWDDPEIGPPTMTFEPSSVTGRTTSTTSTSYPRQSVQTSEPSISTEEPPPPVEVPDEPTPTSTTIYNPYTTTTTNNAGAI